MGLFSRKSKTVFYGTQGTGESAQASYGVSADLGSRDAGQPFGGSAAGGGRFVFRVQDTFSITGRGLVVTGVVESGVITQHDQVTVETTTGPRTTSVDMIEVGRHAVPTAQAGQSAGLALFRLEKDVRQGDVLPGARITSLHAPQSGPTMQGQPSTQSAPMRQPTVPADDAATSGVEYAAGAPAVVTLRLRTVGDRKISVIKELRDATGWSLADTKSVVDAAPVDVPLSISPEMAATLGASLRALGAQADLI